MMVPCTYTASYFRGRPPALMSGEAATPTRSAPPASRQSIVGSDTNGQLPLPGSSKALRAPVEPEDSSSYPLEPGSNNDTLVDPISEPPSHASPEPTQTDLEGHYVGPSSGVSFLLRMQKRLEGGPRTSFSQGTPIFNFGDAPLTRHTERLGLGQNNEISLSLDPSFHLSLSREYTNRLLERYFDFAVPVDRFLHRPTVQKWLDEFYETKGAMYDKSEAPTRMAVLFMMFAVAQEHMVPRPDQAELDMR